MKTALKADLMLVLVTFFWGATYALTKIAVETFSPMNLIALRFGIAFLAMLPLFWRRIVRADKKTVGYSAVLSVVLFLVFTSMTYGVKYTSASNAAFLAGLTVIFIALGSFLFLGQKLNTKTWICVFLSLAGVCLLTITPQLRFNMGIGDILSLLVSVFYAVYVLLIDRYTQEVDSVVLGVLQLGFVGMFAAAASMATERLILPSDTKSLWIIFVLSILCTAFAYVVQTVAQKYTTPTHTGIILSLEIVFSGVFAYLLVGEVLSLINYLGAVLLMAAVLLMEMDLKIFSHKN